MDNSDIHHNDVYHIVVSVRFLFLYIIFDLIYDCFQSRLLYFMTTLLLDSDFPGECSIFMMYIAIIHSFHGQ